MRYIMYVYFFLMFVAATVYSYIILQDIIDDGRGFCGMVMWAFTTAAYGVFISWTYDTLMRFV